MVWPCRPRQKCVQGADECRAFLRSPRAQSKYACCRSSDQPAGGLVAMSRRLQILSASLTSLASRLIAPAWTTEPLAFCLGQRFIVGHFEHDGGNLRPECADEFHLVVALPFDGGRAGSRRSRSFHRRYVLRWQERWPARSGD